MAIDNGVLLIEHFKVAINLLMKRTTILGNDFIDSGANLNVLSWDTWNAMGKSEITPSIVNFIGFFANATPCLGSLLVKMNVQDEPMYMTF